MAKKSVLFILGVITFALIAAVVLIPSLSVALVPAICVLAYYFGYNLGAGIFVISAAIIFSLSRALFEANAFSDASAVFVLSLALSRILRSKLNLFAEIALCAAVGTVAVCAYFGIYALVKGVSVTDLIVSEFSSLESDFVFSRLAQINYKKLTAEDLGHAPLLKNDELFLKEAASEYAHKIGRELEDNLLWYLTGFGAFAGGLSCVGASAIAECRRNSTVKLEDMRLGRAYFLGGILPALLFSLFTLYEPMRPIVRTVFNLFITLPTAFCGITLLYHTAARFSGKRKVIAVIVFWFVMTVSAIFYEWGLLILGFIGFADVVLNVRRLLDWALS